MAERETPAGGDRQDLDPGTSAGPGDGAEQPEGVGSANGSSADPSAAAAARPSLARRIVKVLALVILIAVAVVVLFTTVFPWVEARTQDPTIGVSSTIGAVPIMGALHTASLDTGR